MARINSSCVTHTATVQPASQPMKVVSWYKAYLAAAARTSDGVAPK
jgi:hypothetical protein